MDTCILALLFLTNLTVVFMQTCREFQVQEITQANKFVKRQKISCLLNLTLDQCALECLLVTICTSINHIFNTKAKSFMCELLVDGHEYDFQYQKGSYYVDIRDWTQDFARTCATRPCAANQRCIPTNPYRCMDIDCGIPTVLPYYNMDTNMSISWTNTTIGSKAEHTCLDPNKRIVNVNIGHRCQRRTSRICNSDSTWLAHGIYCEDKTEQ